MTTPTLKQKILERVGFDDGHTNFDDFDAWMEGQCKDASDLSTRYYLPDLRVAFIEGKGVQHAKNLSLVTELLELVTRLNETVNFYSSNANRQCIQWGEIHVCDSYSGGNYLPDWDGDLCDEPWEPADKALADTEATLQRLANDKGER